MADPAAPLLDIVGLSKRFGAVVVAEAIDIRVPAGQALGVLGPNGAGKTTLFAMIAGAVRPTAGRILMDGVDITTASPARRCRLGIARSFQIPQPFGGMSVVENLLVGAAFATHESRRRQLDGCMEILERCGLLAQANRRAGTLTLLQRKRLELARALACRPRLLLLDEIAGGLTEGECQTLVALVRDIHAGGVTLIWIEHIVHALLASVDRLLVLAGGAIIADGAPTDVMGRREVAEIYMGIPADA